MPVSGPSDAEIGPLEIDGEIEIGSVMKAFWVKIEICKMHAGGSMRMESLRVLDHKDDLLD